MAKHNKWTEEKAQKWLLENEPNYTIIKTKRNEKNRLCVLIKCNNLNHDEYWIVWTEFVNKHSRCLQCHNEKMSKIMIKWNDNKIIEWIKNNKPEFNLVNIERIRNKIFVNLQCKKENHEAFKINFSELLRKNRSIRKCKDCIKEEKYEKLKTYIKSINFQLLTNVNDYINSHSIIEVVCPNGHVSKNTLHNLKVRKIKCAECYGNKRKTTEQYKKDVYDLWGDEFEVCEEYINASTPIKHFHKACGNYINTQPNRILSKIGCGICKSSKGEIYVSKWLKSNNILFDSQYAFNDLKGINGGYLSFDFIVFNNLNIYCLIEIDGEGHRKPIDFFGKGEKYAFKKFKIQQQNDKKKNDYCIKNNLKLLRIPYYETKSLSNQFDDILYENLKELINTKEVY